MKKRTASGTESHRDGSGAKYSIHSLQDNLDNLSHLQHEHRQRLQAVEKEYNQLNKFKDDYLHLQKRLKTLPDKTSHEVMVPIGPLAFMPGRLIHTNEILVLLGDNWFAERSGKEAVEIVKRRVKDCDEKLVSAKAQLDIHKNWLKETSSLFEDNTGLVEIKEELTDEEFKRSKEEHKKKVAEESEKRRQSAVLENPRDGPPSDGGGGGGGGGGTSMSQESFMLKLDDSDRKTYEGIMRRLDRLEMEEDEESIGSQDTAGDDMEIPGESYPSDNEAEMAVDPEEEEEEEQPSIEGVISNPKKKLRRRVSWADDKRPLHTVIPDEKSESTYRIKYTTKQLSLPLIEWDPAAQETPEENDDDDDDDDDNIDDDDDENNDDDDDDEDIPDAASAIAVQSPSDIYRVFGERRSSLQEPPAPRGILKKTSSNPESEKGTEGGWNYPHKTNENRPGYPPDVIAPQSSEIPSPEEAESSEPAFNYTIIERTAEPQGVRPPHAASSTDTQNKTVTQNKKISRFKAARMGK